jgi:hypothetical protein
MSARSRWLHADQVAFENDYLGYVAGSLGMYVALLIPAAFVWYFAALSYQFYCWRIIGTISLERLRCVALRCVALRCVALRCVALRC